MQKFFHGLSFDRKKKCIGIALSALVLILLSLCWIFFIEDYIGQINSLRLNINLKSQLVELRNENMDNFDKNLADLDAFTQGLETISDTDAFSPNSGIFYCSQLMADCGLEQLQFNIGEWSPLADSDSVFSVQLSISCIGLYEDVLNYITKLSAANYIYEVTSYTLSSRNVVQKGQVYGAFDISLYSYISEAEAEDMLVTMERGNPFYYDDR